MHEIGHSRNKLLTYLSLAAGVLWIFGLSSVFTIVTLASFITEIRPKLSLLAWLLLIPTLTIVAVVGSWISEHKADIESSKKVGVLPLIKALIKINLLPRYGLFINKIEFKNVDEVATNIRFKNILGLLLNYSLIDAPKEAISFILKPTYPTHPPVILRFFKINLNSKQGEKLCKLERRTHQCSLPLGDVVET